MQSDRHYPCSICGELTFQTCSGCSQRFYCSNEHQEQDWEQGHKMICPSRYKQEAQQLNQNFVSFNYLSFQNLQQLQHEDNQQNDSEEYLDVMQDDLEIQQNIINTKIKLQSTLAICHLDNQKAIQLLLSLLYDNKVKKQKLELSSYILGNPLQLIQLQLMLAKSFIQSKQFANAKQILMNINIKKVQDVQIRQKIFQTISILFQQCKCYFLAEQSLLQYGKIIKIQYTQMSMEYSKFLYQMSLFFFQQGQYNNSLQCMQNCLNIYQSLQKTQDLSIEISDCYYNIGIICLYGDAIDFALENIEKAYNLRVCMFSEENLETAQCIYAQA